MSVPGRKLTGRDLIRIEVHRIGIDENGQERGCVAVAASPLYTLSRTDGRMYMQKARILQVVAALFDEVEA